MGGFGQPIFYYTLSLYNMHRTKNLIDIQVLVLYLTIK